MARIRHATVALLMLVSALSASRAAAEEEPLRADLQARIDALRADDVDTRRKAVYELWQLERRSQFALPALAEAIRDPDEYVRTTAARVLALFDWMKVPAALHAVLPQLIEALDDERIEVRREAAGLLWRVGPTLAEVPEGLLPALERALASEDALLCSRAASVAVNLNVRAKSLAPLLGKRLDHEDPRVRQWMAQAIGATDPRGQLKALLRAFRDEDATVREAALAAVTGMAAPIPLTRADVPKGFVMAVEQALRDPVANVRRAAAGIFWSLMLREGVPSLTKVLLEDPDVTVRSAAALSLGGLGDPSALPALSACTLNQDPAIRGAVALAIGQLGPEGAAALPMLRRLTKDENMGVRASALRGLGYLGAFAAPARDAIVERLADSEIGVRMAATEALLGLIKAGAGDADLVPPLRSVLLDDDPNVRNYAAQVVRALGAPARPLIPVLIRQLEKSDGSQAATVQSLVWTLAGFGPAAADALPVLKTIQTEDRWRQMALVGATACIAPESAEGKAARAQLAGWLADPQRASAALMWLAELGPGAASAAPAMEALLDDRQLRLSAAQTLLQVVSPAPENALFVLLLELEARKNGLLSLTLGDGGRRLAPIAPRLLPYLAAPSPRVRQQVAEALGKLGNAAPPIIEALDGARKDVDATVRMAVAIALKRLSPPEK
ncbi:MAG: HEAT repeat domain-containing protein [Planctomycetota bacterium]|nr:HEAT repeat domain-containing protein [Planctomycetota bacterium]